MEYALCPANHGDLAAIEAMARHIWHSHYYPDVLSLDEIAFFLRKMYRVAALAKELNAGADYWKLEYDRQFVGFMAYQFLPESNKLRLNKLYVLPDYQRLGIGQFALNQVKSVARQIRATEVYLYVFRKNLSAVNAYQKAGFQIVRAEYTPCEDGYAFDDYVMAYAMES